MREFWLGTTRIAIAWAPEDGTGAAVADAGATPSAGSEDSGAAASGSSDGSGEAGGSAPAAASPDDKARAKPQAAPVPDWRDRRIAQLKARLAEAEAKGQQTQAPASPQAQPVSADRDEAEVNRRAAALAEAKEFASRCQAAAEEGQKQFGQAEFQGSVSALSSAFVDPKDRASVENYNTFLAAALETGEAPRLVYELGKNLNEAARIMSLSPVKMAVELAKLASKPAPQLTKAPEPPKALGGKGGSTTVDVDPGDTEKADKLSTAEWMKRREAQLRERRGR